jgi:diguanylate cyclase (GGDEF)-like protein
MIQNVTQRREAEAALLAQAELNEHQALHDALTGLANRTLFRDRIDHAAKTARRSESRAAVLLMDLDRFKEINDSLGHAAGDELLVELGARLEAALRASDTVARLGGDEFGVLIPDATVPDDVLRVIDRMQSAIAEPVTVQGLPLSLEASIGVALFPDDGEDVDTLLQRADVAMYQAKEENACFAFYDEGSSGTHDPGRLTLVGELRRALEERELVLYYQPKAVLADGDVRSVEALLRWYHPVRGLVPPDDFIPLAQQTGLVKPLTLYVVDEALRQCRAWLDDGLRLSIAVNLSTRNLLDVQFPTEVQGLLERWEVDPSLLELEITESTMLADPVRRKQILERLSEMGIRLSIDDFAPATRRSPTSRDCRSTRSRSTARSSCEWTPARTTRRSCARRSTRAATSASRSSPRASRPRRCGTRSARSDAPSPRATTSAARSRRTTFGHGSRRAAPRTRPPRAELSAHPLDADEQRVERPQPQQHARDPAVGVGDDAQDAVELELGIPGAEDGERLPFAAELDRRGARGQNLDDCAEQLGDAPRAGVVGDGAVERRVGRERRDHRVRVARDERAGEARGGWLGHSSLRYASKIEARP